MEGQGSSSLLMREGTSYSLSFLEGAVEKPQVMHRLHLKDIENWH